MTIRNDATRLRLRTRDPRPARSVVSRQGQALLDADLNQQSQHLLERIESETQDTFGSPDRLVVPTGSSAFAVTPDPTGSAIGIGAGRGYLDGWAVECPEPGCTIGTQPHARDDGPIPDPVAVVLKSLVRHIDPVEESAYADPALGDAQTPGRALVDWQVFPFAPAGAWGSPACATILQQKDYLRLTAPSTGTLAVVPDAAPPAADPCSLEPAGGYSRSENLLYRIEVDGGMPRKDYPAVDGPRFGLDGLRLKMSRRNASVMVRIVSVKGERMTVEPPPLDPVNWFYPGTFAELVSAHDDIDPRDAAATDRVLQVNYSEDDVVVVATAAAPAVAGKTGWFLRLWDGFADGHGIATVTTDAATPDVSKDIDLGDGLKVRLGAGTGGAAQATFRRGDYWTFAARSDGTIDWPAGTVFETPHGPETRYAPLAVLTGAPPVADDCRIPSATLTDRALLYRGGDGQAVPAPAGGGFAILPSKLRVAVQRGRAPVKGARLLWSAPAALSTPDSRIDGSVVGGAATLEVVTGADGTSEVEWSVDSAFPLDAHRVQVTLLDGDGNPEGTVMVFTAQFATAAGTSYQPGACNVLAQSTTVQEALDALCAAVGGEPAIEPETLALTSINLLGPQGTINLVVENLIQTGLDVPYNAFIEGIGIGISGNPLECRPAEFDPVVEVELDLPYPTTDHDRLHWAQASIAGGGIGGSFGFQNVRLDGTVEVTHGPINQLEPGLVWLPSKRTMRFLETVPWHRFGTEHALLPGELAELGWEQDEPHTILCRLRVRSAHVWTTGKSGERVWLNAEHLGTSNGFTGRELMLHERDPQRAADIEVFFYLQPR
ncbi:hypothetical protein ACFCVO_00170 [Agromyces sp. NPDC056379]|uniref:hypothetical protein n=1 Tax=unclassified Agromyces TaxID=2639701 RepID=UPI0035DD5DCD